jgi:N-hydroxyarylamine O-acetyltransferase
MKVIKYLNRIHAVKKENHNLDYLTHLQEQHILNIHFENLDILNKKPISLDKEDLFRKMIVFERGGVCYELNGLFYSLLKELGFTPELMTGTVHVKDDIWAIENGHLFMIVPLNNKEYIVDVGLGAKCPRVPVPMSGEVVIDSMETYRVKENEEQRTFDLEKRTCSGWKILYRFRKTRKVNTLQEIYPICHLTETSPQSIFNQKYFLSRELTKGRITLLGNTLTRVSGKEVIKEDIETHKLAAKIKQYFQINVSKV